MKNIQLFLLFATFTITFSCKKQENKQITNSKDYDKYVNTLENKALENTKSDFKFWKQKLNKTPNQYPYNAKLASANTAIFKLTGNIVSLKNAEQNLIIANEKTNYNNAGYLRALAKNYISQHRFKEALDLLNKAEINGEKLQQTQLMLIDVNLELGNLKETEKYLSKITNFKSFDYLIRLSKYNDHIGNLDKAIAYLEASLEIAKSSNKTSLIEWNYTNLADYYGHAGRIKDSYKAYLKALELNPNNSYAKKGIAWILFSYERNPEEALKILDAVTKENASPDYYLLKAEIAEFMGNTTLKERNINQYLEVTKNSNYGVMYHKYDILLFTEKNDTKSKALEIAKQEVLERPTAQSYDLLAWAYFKNGQKEKALNIIEKNVLNHTFEPESLLHSAFILKANNKDKQAQLLKEELLGAVYELGPLAEKEIKNI